MAKHSRLPKTYDLECVRFGRPQLRGITPVEEVVFRPLNLPTCVSDCGLTG